MTQDTNQVIARGSVSQMKEMGRILKVAGLGAEVSAPAGSDQNC